MRTKILLLVIGITSNVLIYSQETIKPVQIMGSFESGYTPRELSNYIPDETQHIHLLKFKQDNPDVLIAVFVFTKYFSSFNGSLYTFLSSKTWEFDLQSEITQLISEDNEVTNIEETATLPNGESDRIFRKPPLQSLSAGELIVDSTSVFIDGKQLMLENAFVPTYHYSLLGSRKIFLERAAASQTKNLIGGALKVEFLGGRQSGGYHKIALWNQLSGNMIFQATMDHEGPLDFDCLKIGFSMNEQFFYLREINQFYSKPSVQVGQYNTENILTTGILMVNTETFEEFPADKDVAFTNDGRFYVTAVDGVPSLVSTTHGKARQQYNIDGKIMTAAAVSPDDQHIYIATHTDEIYVFPSQLPTSHVEEWEVYE